MGMSMSGPSRMSKGLTATPSTTSLPELEGGVTPSGSLAGPMTGPSGQAVARVSHSRQQGKAKGRKTPAISGPIGSGSSASIALAQSLGNKLQARLVLAGSTLYRLTWKERTTPSGRSISALRGSGHRTSDSGSGSLAKGWTTPQAHDSSPRGKGQKIKHGTTHGCADLNADAALASWPTVTQEDAWGGNPTHPYAYKELRSAVMLTSWGTPRSVEVVLGIAVNPLDIRDGPLIDIPVYDMPLRD